jgi:hypothetical protein
VYKLNGSITLYSKDMYIHSYVHMSILIDHHSIVYSFTIYSSIDISFDFSSSCLFYNNNNIILYHTGEYVIGKSLKSLSHTEKKRKSYASKSNLLLLVDRSIDNRLWSYLSFEKKKVTQVKECCLWLLLVEILLFGSMSVDFFSYLINARRW